MSKTETVPTTAPNGPHDKADDAVYDEIASVWDAKFQEAKVADDVEAKAADEIIGKPDNSVEPAADEAPEAVVTEQAQPPSIVDDVDALLARAREEAEARTRFKQERSFEQEIATARAEAEALKSRFKQSPLEVIKELGLNPIDLANHAYAEALGDEAPAEFKQKLNQTSMERRVEEKLRELDQREQKWQQAQQQREAQAMIAQLDQELVATVHNAPDNHRLFKQAANRDQNYAYEALVEATNQYYQASGGKLPTAQVALQIAEAGLERLNRLFAQEQKNSDAETLATESKEDRKKSGSKSLSDSDTAERPSRRSAQEPDARDTNAWIRHGLRAIERKT
jgi:hypothetical protein